MFFAIGNLLMFFIAILAGTIVSALLVIVLKRFVRRRPIEVDDETATAASAPTAAPIAATA